MDEKIKVYMKLNVFFFFFFGEIQTYPAFKKKKKLE